MDRCGFTIYLMKFCLRVCPWNSWRLISYLFYYFILVQNFIITHY
jgi:hypothetical protein